MLVPPRPNDEAARLAVLNEYQVLDTEPERLYDNITSLASKICGTPVALVSLVDEKRQWFKSAHGAMIKETPRDLSFCAHTILQSGVFEVENAAIDLRFADNPFVTGDPHVGFYAGAPLKTPSGQSIGTLCVIDHHPRKLDESQLEALERLADQVVVLLELRKSLRLAQEAETRARDSHQRLFDTLNNLPIGVSILRGPDHVYFFTNEIHAKYFGGRKDFVGKPVAVAVPEVNKTTVLQLLDRVYQTGEPYFAEEYPIDFVQPNGELQRFYLRMAFQPLRLADGKVDGIISTSVDITDRVLARKVIEEKSEQIARAERRLQNAIDVAQVGFYDWDMLTDQVTYSDLMRKTWDIENGTPLEEALSRVLPEDRDRLIKAIEKTSRDGSHLSQVYRIRRPSDGRIVWIEAEGDISFDESGRPVRFFGISMDITGRKANEMALIEAREEADRANSAKSAFLANMSHEIRSPLGAIMGFSDLMKDPDLSYEEMQKFVSVIDRNSVHVLRVVDDILDLSKVEAGKMMLEHLDFSLPELLADFSSMMVLRAREKGIEFEVKIPNEIPSEVRSDSTRIRQILTNVVGNAIKFTEAGKVTLTVNYQVGCLEFLIEDTGIGISPEQKKSLFQPFQQADVSMTRKFGGTGLGLILTRRIAELMGGHFELRSSQPGRGSLFVASVRVDLPVRSRYVSGSSLSFVAKPVEFKQSEERVLEGLKILVVEDSLDNQALFRMILSKLGAEVTMASDGLEGVEAALGRPHDVILMDIQMPRMDGHTAVKTMRSKGIQIPVIALSAHAMKEERERALGAGFTSYLTKPIHKETLVKHLREHLHS